MGISFYQLYKILENQTNQILDLKKKRFGWIDPEGEIIPTEFYNHLQAVENHPDFQQAVEEIKWLRWADQETNRDDPLKKKVPVPNYYQYVDDDYHTEIAPDEYEPKRRPHEYDPEAYNLADRKASEIYKELYQRGWVRLGLYDNVLHVEGNKEHFRKHIKNIKDIAAFLRGSYKLEPVN